MSWVWHKPERKVSKPQWDKVPADPHAERLEDIYTWERRCRGYDLFAQPVPLEPSWIPFEADNNANAKFDPASMSLAAMTGGSGAPTRFMTLRLPTAQKVAPQASVAWLQSLPSFPASFEIIGSNSEIVYQLGINESGSGHSFHDTGSSSEQDVLQSSFTTHFPMADLEAGDDVLRRSLSPFKGQPVGYSVVDFGLLNLAYQPLQRWSRFAFDPLSSLVNILGQISLGEVAGLQVLFSPVRQAWTSAIQQVAQTFSDGGNATARFSANPNDSIVQASAKTDSPLFAVVVRIFAISRNGNTFRSNDQIAFDLCRRLGQSLSPLSSENSNALLALDNQSANRNGDTQIYDDEDHFRDLLARQTRRHGMLLSLDELVGLAHPPCETVQHPRLVRPVPGEESLPPHLLQSEGALLGLHAYRSQEQRLVWPDAFRNRHAYLLGATRMGKSTLLLNLIAQDLEAGRGLCLIDPHGDLAKDVLALVPPQRNSDTLYLDFADRDHPPALGLLQAGDEWEARLLCSDLLSILRRLFASSWGDRLEHILRHVLLTLLSDQSQVHTLRDIRPLLSDKAYRERVLESLSDLDLKAFWRSEFPSYNPSTFSPIYNKLGLLLSSPIIRNIVAQSQSKLHLSSVMSSGVTGRHRILLVNLNQSLIGEDNAHFLGAMLVSKLQIGAMQSLRRERVERVPFTLYVDEFQNFVVSSFEKILSEAGKAGLSLVMANQFLEQLPAGLQMAILGNVGTLVSFRVSSEGGRLLEREMAGKFKQNDLVSLERGEAVARIGQARHSYFIKTLPPPQVATPLPTSSTRNDGNEEADAVSAIIERTRIECCRSRAEVEVELNERAEMLTPKNGGPGLEQLETPPTAARKTTDKKRSSLQVAIKDLANENSTSILTTETIGGEEDSLLVSMDSDLTRTEMEPANTELITTKPIGIEPECFGVPDDEPLTGSLPPSQPKPPDRKETDETENKEDTPPNK